MDTHAFLEACRAGNSELIDSLEDAPFEHKRELTYSLDEDERNGLHLAILNGHWKLAIHLVRKLKVSPHKLTRAEESVFHSIVRGLAVLLPTLDDFQDLRDRNMKAWEEQNQQKMQQIQDLERENPNLHAPRDLLEKDHEEQAQFFFDNPRVALAKYILYKFHVVLRQENREGKTPADLARDFGFEDLVTFYEQELSAPYMKKRLISGLNENLFKKVVKFL